MLIKIIEGSIVNSCRNVKLNVRPVFVMFNHKYYYEGPCRMAVGEAIQPNFDQIVNGQLLQANLGQIRKVMPDCVHLLDPVKVEVTDDWDIRESYFETLFAGREDTDAYLASNSFGADAVFNEFCVRAGKLIVILPNIWNPAKSGYLYNMGVDVYTKLDWDDTIKRLKNARREKSNREIASGERCQRACGYEEGAPEPVRKFAFRRRAADARDRSGTNDESGSAADGRTLRGSLADGHQTDW